MALAQTSCQGLQARGSPGAQMAEAVIALREDEGQPDRHQMAKTQALPIAVSGKRLIEQFRHAHLFQLGEEQWNVIDSFVSDW
jgi:hypothetical protein